MTKPTAVLFCPGRGSYGREELGYLKRMVQPGPVAEALDASDAWRREQQKTPIRDLDASDKFRPGVHLEGENAAELIYFSTLAHAEHLRSKYRILAVAGNSLGWYTALPASGALDPTSGWRLVATMAALQKQNAGGQILTTTVGEDWRTDAMLVQGVEQALAKVNARGADHFNPKSPIMFPHHWIDAQVMYYPTEVGTMRGADSTPEERAAWPESEKWRHGNVEALTAASPAGCVRQSTLQRWKRASRCGRAFKLVPVRSLLRHCRCRSRVRHKLWAVARTCSTRHRIRTRPACRVRSAAFPPAPFRPSRRR